MRKIFILLPIILFTLFCINLQVNAEPSNSTIIIPGKSLGNIEIGENYQNLQNKLGSDIENYCSTKKGMKEISLNMDDGGIFTLSLKNNLVKSIDWSFPSKTLLYKTFNLIPFHTNLPQIQNLIPGGKIKAHNERRYYLIYKNFQKGIDFYFEPLINIVNANYLIKNKQCITKGYKLYECFVLTGVKIYKTK